MRAYFVRQQKRGEEVSLGSASPKRWSDGAVGLNARPVLVLHEGVNPTPSRYAYAPSPPPTPSPLSLSLAARVERERGEGDGGRIIRGGLFRGRILQARGVYSVGAFRTE